MTCITGIAKAIVSDCSTVKAGGNEVVAWVFNRKDVDITYDSTNGNLITDFANLATKKAYQLTGVKKMLNTGHDIVVAEDRPDKYNHYFSFQQFEIASEDIKNVDEINDVIVVVERLDKTDDGDGGFVAYGAKFGLGKSSDTRRSNDVNGARVIELTSMEGREEPFSEYTVLATDYAGTVAMLTAALSVPA